MSAEFIARILGMFVFLFLSIGFGLNNVELLGLTGFSPQFVSVLFALVGILMGLIITPYLTTRPLSLTRRILTEVSVETMLISFIGLIMGLLVVLLATYPLSLLPNPFGAYVPIFLATMASYLGLTIFGARAKEIIGLFRQNARPASYPNDRELLLDTSVLIDGRIVEIAQTGFLGGKLIVPRFVLSELHHVADSSDSIKRNRGRRGLAILNELQRDPQIELRIIEDDISLLNEVDDKLVALALQRDSGIVTNDFNLNQVATAQNVLVLNINALANAVRSIYIPGESFSIYVLQEGREENQGVGYLEDGTMVIIENGNNYLDRTINVEVTRLITREAGRILFAKPTNTSSR